MIYFLSDIHWHHDRDFLYGNRGFKNIWEHDEALIKNINNTVSAEDILYILGDVMLGDNEFGLKLLKQIKCKVIIIKGNHDTDTRVELYNSCWNVEEVVEAKTIKYGKFRFYLSHYPTLCANFDDGKRLFQHTINLCGHTHTTDKFSDMDKGIIYHVDADAHNCTPISIEKIIEDLRKYYESRNRF